MKKFLAMMLATLMLVGCGASVADPAVNSAEPTASSVKFDEEVDVLIIGAGGSGMTAAIEAKTAGAEKVVVLEKQETLNSITYLCEGILSGYETQLTKKQDIHYTAQDCYNEMMEKSGYILDPKLTMITAEQCGPLIDWLIDEIGVEFEEKVDAIPFYGPHELLHHVKGGGAGYRDPFTRKLEELDVELRFQNKAVELIGNEAHNEVIGAKIETPEGSKMIKADAVVLCTGGYANSTEMIQRMNPRNMCLKTNRPEGPATGDGMIMASEFGALLHNQDDAKYGLGDYSGNRNSFRGTIMVGNDGLRFRDEKGHFDLSPAAMRVGMNRAGVDFVWAIEDDAVMQASESDLKALEKNENVIKADSIAELAEKTGIDAENLQNTIDNWNSFCDKGVDEEFVRDPATMQKIDKAPYYALKLGAGVGMSFGGIARTEKGEVLKVNGNTIPGLYVAGEAAEAASANGWTCSHALTWGRIAGKNAAAYAMSK